MKWPPQLKVIKRPNGRWWIVGLVGGARAGSYDTRAEAESDKAGLLRHYEANAEWWLNEVEEDKAASELWYELEYDLPAPARGTPQWTDLFEEWCRETQT